MQQDAASGLLSNPGLFKAHRRTCLGYMQVLVTTLWETFAAPVGFDVFADVAPVVCQCRRGPVLFATGDRRSGCAFGM